jgi:iron complex outermembrane receptor protein
MHGTRFEEGNPNLSPQNAWETDFSSHFHGDFVSFDGAIFYNRINDYIHLAPTNEVTSEDVAIYRYGQTDAQLFGGEAGLHVHPESAPWLHIKGAWSTVTGKQENGNYLPFIPADKFRYEIRGTKNKLGFIKKPSVKLSAISALEQDQPSPGETSTEGYTVIHATINGQFQVFEQPLDFTLGVNNLFNKEYIDHLSTLKNLGYRNQGRNVFMSLQFSFGR